jgi:probable F420-dependent oxidoreductase
MRPFRFAVQASNAADGDAWRALARQCESLGYSTLFIPDHFGDQWGPLVALTVASECTTELNVGTLVLDNDYRHPVVVAKELMTLDHVSKGRLEVGIGAGWMRTDYDESGIDYDDPGTRVDRMTEGIQILKDMWINGSATLAGKHYTVANALGAPRPHSARPKLLIGGGSPRVLGIAAREADIVGVNPSLRSGAVGAEALASAVPSMYDQRVGWLRDAAGSRFDDLELQALTFFVQVGVDRDQAAANFAPVLGLSAEEVLDVPLGLMGTVDQICESLERRRERWGFSYCVIHTPEMEAFAPVVERLAGK